MRRGHRALRPGLGRLSRDVRRAASRGELHLLPGARGQAAREPGRVRRLAVHRVALLGLRHHAVGQRAGAVHPRPPRIEEALRRHLLRPPDARAGAGRRSREGGGRMGSRRSSHGNHFQRILDAAAPRGSAHPAHAPGPGAAPPTGQRRSRPQRALRDRHVPRRRDHARHRGPSGVHAGVRRGADPRARREHARAATSDERSRAALETVRRPSDGPLIGRWIAAFLRAT